MRVTAYDDWCMKNGIKAPSYFLDDILKLGEHDERFKEAADYLRKLEDTKLDIEPDIDNVEAFESRMVHCYGFGLIPSYKMLHYLIFGLDKSDELNNSYNDAYIEKLYGFYKENYNAFLNNVEYLLDNEKSIMDQYNSEIDSLTTSRKPTQKEINEIAKLFKMKED